MIVFRIISMATYPVIAITTGSIHLCFFQDTAKMTTSIETIIVKNQLCWAGHAVWMTTKLPKRFYSQLTPSSSKEKTARWSEETIQGHPQSQREEDPINFQWWEEYAHDRTLWGTITPEGAAMFETNQVAEENEKKKKGMAATSDNWSPNQHHLPSVQLKFQGSTSAPQSPTSPFGSLTVILDHEGLPRYPVVVTTGSIHPSIFC